MATSRFPQVSEELIKQLPPPDGYYWEQETYETYARLVRVGVEGSVAHVRPHPDGYKVLRGGSETLSFATMDEAYSFIITSVLLGE